MHEIPEHIEALFDIWPRIEHMERWHRRMDWAMPVVMAAVIVLNLSFDSLVNQIVSVVLAFSVGMLVDAARWRRRSFQRMKQAKEGLQFSIAMATVDEEDER